jgi:kynureninase
MTDFTATRAMFDLPEGIVYLDGNSLGPLPRGVAARVARTITEEWGQMLITGWNRAGWMALPTQLGNRLGRLIGADTGQRDIGRYIVNQGLSGTCGGAGFAARPAGDLVRYRQFPV